MVLGKLLEALLVKEILKGKSVSKYKIQILKILAKEEPKTISELMRDLNISYKETHRHVKELVEKSKFVNRQQKKKGEKHAPVYLRLTDSGKWYAEMLMRYS